MAVAAMVRKMRVRSGRSEPIGDSVIEPYALLVVGGPFGFWKTGTPQMQERSLLAMRSEKCLG